MSFVWQPIKIPAGAATPYDEDGSGWVASMTRMALTAATIAAVSMATQARAAQVRVTQTDDAPNVTACADDTGTPWPPPFVLRVAPQIPQRTPPWLWPITETAGSLTPARGPATAATLHIILEAGAQVTYSWSTDILRSRAGYESRLALVATPRESYDFAALLSDSDLNLLQSELVFNEAAGGAFAIGLEHEALLVTAGAGKTVTVPTTAFSDWMYAGQTALVIGLDGSTTATGVVQSFTSTTITLDTDVSAVAVPGARIMPTIPCYLDASQGFGLYPVNLSTLSLKARAAYFGNASGAWAPRGATVTAYTDFFGVTRTVWDRGLVVAGTAPRSALADTTLADRGGARVLQASGQPVVDFAREIAFTLEIDADRQLLKAFHGSVQGRQKAFLLPTWRPDLVMASGDASGGTITTKATTDYAGQWFKSAAHKWIQILMTSGTVFYRTITDQHDNGDGTQTLQLDAAAAGTIATVSFLELCRLDSDDIVVRYDAGCIGSCRIPCRVVQQ